MIPQFPKSEVYLKREPAAFDELFRRKEAKAEDSETRAFGELAITSKLSDLPPIVPAADITSLADSKRAEQPSPNALVSSKSSSMLNRQRSTSASPTIQPTSQSLDSSTESQLCSTKFILVTDVLSERSKEPLRAEEPYISILARNVSSEDLPRPTMSIPIPHSQPRPSDLSTLTLLAFSATSKDGLISPTYSPPAPTTIGRKSRFFTPSDPSPHPASRTLGFSSPSSTSVNVYDRKRSRPSFYPAEKFREALQKGDDMSHLRPQTGGFLPGNDESEDKGDEIGDWLMGKQELGEWMDWEGQAEEFWRGS